MKNNFSDSKIIKNKVSLNPYVFKTPSISSVMIRVLVLLILQIVMLFITKSFNAIYVITATTVGALCAYALSYVFNRRQLYTGLVTLVQGILIGMFLPETYPVVTAFFVSFFVVILSRFIFEKCVTSWVNIVATAVIAAWFIGKRFFPGFLITADLLPLKNPSTIMINNGIFPVYGFDTYITSFLNNTIFSWLKVTLPEGYISLLCDTHSIIPAFRFNLLTLLASVVLYSDDPYSGIIPAIFIGTYAILVRVLSPVLAGGVINQGDVILALNTSGTLFTAFFLLCWFGTHPVTVSGKILYGIIAGVLAFVIVGCGTSPIGMIYTVVICNVLNLLIRVVEERRNEALLVKESLKLVKEV